MGGERAEKSYWRAKKEEEVKKGRPRLIWRDDVESDLRNVDVNR
jgi:hypothetical protein